jgi:hypothetical protein
LQVLTGKNRDRGTLTAAAFAKSEMAAPIAVSNWYTGGLFSSLGLRVLELRINGSSILLFFLNILSNEFKLIQILLVLKYL